MSSTATSSSDIVLFVQLDLHPGQKEEFFRDFTPLVQHVQENEKSITLAYQVYVGREKPDTVFIYERYVDEHAWHEVHEKSEPFLAWSSKWFKLMKGVTVNSVTETGLGFLTR